jgi:elongation factor P--(R)-beta-lysine ligase
MPWQSSASIDILRKRALYHRKIRHFFDEKGYLEVETPYMARFGVTDPMLANIKASFRDETYYLQTSPEYHMKRLLASGSGPIYQMARVFRDDEFGRWHNPEFSLLEWYQLDVSHWYLMQELESLLKYLGNVPDFLYLSYKEAFESACGFNPLTASLQDIQATCKRFDLAGVLAVDESIDQHLHLLMAFVVEPYLKTLNQPVIIYHFPASQASLAKVEEDVALRFELYWQGVELANGFYEQTDAAAQMRRFEEDNAIRQSLELQPMLIDTQLMAALQFGMPACSGLALGLDRLFALLEDKTSLAEVMSFPFPEL